jgi:transcriptional regulator with XRE-family HTH domain
MSLGKRIADARKTAGLTQAQLADRLSVVQSAVSAWEKSANEPTLETLRQIAFETNSSVVWLTLGIKTPERQGMDCIPIHSSAAISHSHKGDRENQPVICFPSHWLRGLTDALPKDLAVLRANDFSFEEVSFSGAFVLIDLRVKKVGSPGIYAINHPASDEIRIAWCQRRLKTGKLFIFNNNPRLVIAEDDIDDTDISIVGKAIWGGRRL